MADVEQTEVEERKENGAVEDGNGMGKKDDDAVKDESNAAPPEASTATDDEAVRRSPSPQRSISQKRKASQDADADDGDGDGGAVHPTTSATASSPSHEPLPSSTTQGGEEASASASSPPPSSPPRAGTKRPRRPDLADAQGRGRRMFGLLNATLGKAKRESEARGDQSKRRAEIEQRQKERLDAQRRELERASALRRALEPKYRIEIELCEALLAGEASHRSMRASKRRLASFLVTSSGDGRSGQDRDRDRHRRDGPFRSQVAPKVPSSLAPLTDRDQALKHYPLYFLPKTLTPEQEDVLDEQEDRVDEEIEESDKMWERERDRLNERLDEVRREIARLQQAGAETDTL